CDKQHPYPQRDLTDGPVEQGLEVLTVRGPEEPEHGKWQDAEDYSGDSSLCGERLDLAAETIPLQHRVGDGREDLGEVTADFSLDLDGHDCPFEVVRLGAFRDTAQRLADRA